jgi:hypothetical protein
MRTRLRWFGLPEAALLIAFVVAWALIAHQGLRNHVLQPDEAIPVFGSRYIDTHFPGGLFSSGASGRGLERAIAYGFALFQWLLSTTPSVFKAMHVVLAGSCAAVALVVWAWARELGLDRWTAAGAGIAAVALPWSVFGITFLNAGPAQALTALALYACWRAIVRPGPTRDVLALAALLLLGLVRVGNLTVAVVVPVAVLVAALAGRPPGVLRVRAIVREFRAHPVWLAVGAAAIVVLALGGIHRVVGHYPVRSPLGASVKAELRTALGQIGAGVALFPAAVAGAWGVRCILRPRDRGGAALATLLLGAFAVLAYAAATQGPEERYVSAVAPLVVLGFAVALARREAGVVGTALAALVVGREVVLHGFPLVGLPFGALGSPATTFFQRVAVGKASLHLPVGAGHPATTLAILAGFAAVLLVIVARRRTAVALTAGLGFLALYGGAAAIYSMHKFVTGAGFPGLNFAEQAWVDGKVGTGADVAILSDPAIDAGSDPIFREVRLFNRSTGLRPALDLGAIADPRTGTLHGAVPRYVVEVPRTRPLGLDAQQVASTTYLPQPLVLAELAQPPRLAWAQQPGTRGRIVVRFFAGPAGRCAVIGIQAQLSATGPHRYVLTMGSRHVAGVLDGIVPVTQTVPLPPGRTVDARLRIAGGGQLVALSAVPCP